jgi:hypothetical protein
MVTINPNRVRGAILLSFYLEKVSGGLERTFHLPSLLPWSGLPAVLKLSKNLKL